MADQEDSQFWDKRDEFPIDIEGKMLVNCQGIRAPK